METSKKNDREPIEYETVTLKLPKKVMEWLRRMEPMTGRKAIEELEFNVVDYFRAELEACTTEELIPCIDVDLANVFCELLEDKRYQLKA